MMDQINLWPRFAHVWFQLTKYLLMQWHRYLCKPKLNLSFRNFHFYLRTHTHTHICKKCKYFQNKPGSGLNLKLKFVCKWLSAKYEWQIFMGLWICQMGCFLLPFFDHLYPTSELLLQHVWCGDLPLGLGAQTQPFEPFCQETFASSLVDNSVCRVKLI